jgi:cyclophilin family peptidyl-prolyl cis-trans isomerase
MNKTLAAIIIGISLLTSCKSEKDFLVTIRTPYGDMKAILYDETPKHKANFIKLAKDGFYDSILFHRVMKEFMIQGGDPDSKGAAKGAALGTGGPSYTVPAEFIKSLHHHKGALSAARQPDNVNSEKASSASQFYVVQGKVWTEEELTVDMNKLGMAAQQLMQQPKYDSIKQLCMNTYQSEGPEAYGKLLVEMKDFISEVMKVKVTKDMSKERLDVYTSTGGTPHLDDEYTVFGKVVSGLEVIDKIAEQTVDRRNRPLEDITMVVELEELTKKKITKEYGYIYPEEK